MGEGEHPRAGPVEVAGEPGHRAPGAARPRSPGTGRDSGGAPRAARLVVAGTLLGAVASLGHPPTFDPRDAAGLMAHVQADPLRWVAVHAGFGLGVLLWTMGVWALASRRARRDRTGWTLLALPCLAAALSLWLSAMVWEAAALPPAVRQAALAAPAQPVAAPAQAAPAGAASESLGWLRATWPAVLASGYAAAALQWLAGLALAASQAGEPGPAGRRGRAGLALLPPGLAGMVLAWLYPQAAVPLMAILAGPGAGWFLAWAVGEARKGKPAGFPGR